MYTVHMARYTATDARRHFFQLLDAAEQGEEIVLERHGVRFKLMLEESSSSKLQKKVKPLLTADEAVLEGNWTWVSDDEGNLQFNATSGT